MHHHHNHHHIAMYSTTYGRKLQVEMLRIRPATICLDEIAGACKRGKVKSTLGQRVYSRSHLWFSYFCRRCLSWYFPRNTALMKGMSLWFGTGQKVDLLASARSLTWAWVGNCCSLLCTSWTNNSFSLSGFSLNKGSPLYDSKSFIS